MLRHVVDKHADAQRQMVAAQVAQIVAAVVRRVVRQARHQAPGPQVLADLVAGHLRDAFAIEHRLQHQVGIVEAVRAFRLHLADGAIDLEFPLENTARGETEIDAGMSGQRVDAVRQAVRTRVFGRGAQQHLHRNQLFGDHLAVVHAAIAKCHVDAVGNEIGGAVVEHQVEPDVGKLRVKAAQQRRDHLAAEADGGRNAQLAARRAAAQFAHLFHRLHDAVDAGPAVFIKQFALGGQGGAARGAQEQTRIELGFKLLHAAADGGAADAQPLRRLGKTAFVDHRDKGHHAGVGGGKARRQGVAAVAGETGQAHAAGVGHTFLSVQKQTEW